MQAVNAEVDGGALTRFDDFVFHLLLHLGHYFLNAGGVDAAIGDELVQGETADFATHGVESRNDNGLGGVVDHDFHARGGFECTDVATLASDDAALHFVVVDVEHGHAVLDGRFGGHALNGLYDNALGLLVGRKLGIVHNVVDVALRIGASLILE